MQPPPKSSVYSPLIIFFVFDYIDRGTAGKLPEGIFRQYPVDFIVRHPAPVNTGNRIPISEEVMNSIVLSRKQSISK